jgi:hypothetical protein
MADALQPLVWVGLINIVLIALTLMVYFGHLRARRRRDAKYRPHGLASQRRPRKPARKPDENS